MAYEFPCVPYVTLYILSFCIIQSNSKTSAHWKVDEEGKIVEVKSRVHNETPETGVLHCRTPKQDNINNGPYTYENDLPIPIIEDDSLMQILASPTIRHGDSWTKISQDENNEFCSHCSKSKFTRDDQNYINIPPQSRPSEENTGGKNKTRTREIINNPSEDEVLDCGKTNFTYYDHLVGIANRQNHPNVPEPQVTMTFRKKNSKKDFDMDALEKKLRKAKKEKPKSIQLYNQIGNFWRIKGDTRKSIECFRRALSVSPNNAEVLLNLARVLLNLQYLDDAIFLTRRSLEVQIPEKSTWEQHFTLGEIYKAYGQYQDAVMHMRLTLELKPDFQPALLALRDMDSWPDKSLHKYTILIIVFLVLGVLLVILASMDGGMEDYVEIKPQRHFNRAMAMRSIKMGISPRSLRTKRYSNGAA